jgi:ribosomal protein L16 Arg81 hydroxylase
VSNGFPALGGILEPLAPGEFFEKHWGQRAIQSGPSSGRFGAMFSRERLAEIIRTLAYPNPALLYFQRGVEVQPTSATDVVSAIKDGATVSLDRVEDFDPDVRALVAGLEADLGERVKVHAYLSQRDHRGLIPHYDTHDVFVLQVEGRKHWRVYEPTIESPLRQTRPPREACPEVPYLDVLLEPGDTLYLPRGHWHEALAVDGESLHLSTGVHPKTGVDFVRWLAERMAQDSRFRKAIGDPWSAASARDFGVPTLFSDRVRDLVAALREALDDPTLDARFAAYCRSSLKDRASEVSADPAGAFKVTSNRPLITADGEDVLLAVPGHSLRFSKSSAPILVAAFELNTFTEAELAHRSAAQDRDIRLVLATLLATGLVSRHSP